MADCMARIRRFTRIAPDDCMFSGELSRFTPESLVTMRSPVLRAGQTVSPASAD